MAIVAVQPSPEHARHFANLAQMAGDDLFTQMLGGRADVMLRAMFGRDDNDFSHRHATFLAEGDEIAGMLHGYAAPEAQDSRTTRLMLRYALWQLPRFLAVALFLGDVLEFMGKDLADDDFYIAFLAVYPAYRGRGLSQTLLQCAEARARERGCSRLALDVDSRNRIAINAYDKWGFETIAKSKQVSHAGERFGVQRMAKDLTDGLSHTPSSAGDSTSRPYR